VEAAFLRNFAHYVTWPPHAFSDDRAPWRVCVLGADPFGAVLEKTFAGRTERGRAFELHRGASLAQLPPCHIIFVAYPTSAERRAALNELRRQSVLTVSEAPEFLEEGGVVRFQITDYVEMSINLDQARAASLIVPTRLLEVSREVLDHGVLRKTR
jgi:hypothetical protein